MILGRQESLRRQFTSWLFGLCHRYRISAWFSSLSFTLVKVTLRPYFYFFYLSSSYFLKLLDHALGEVVVPFGCVRGGSLQTGWGISRLVFEPRSMDRVYRLLDRRKCHRANVPVASAILRIYWSAYESVINVNGAPSRYGLSIRTTPTNTRHSLWVT